MFEPGALVFVGDGHAAQGDGEIVGSDIETSMDVEFTVNLQKDKTIGWMRGENGETSSPLATPARSIQHATTEML